MTSSASLLQNGTKLRIMMSKYDKNIALNEQDADLRSRQGVLLV